MQIFFHFLSFFIISEKMSEYDVRFDPKKKKKNMLVVN